MTDQPSYWGILPANVRYDKRLCPMARILYSEITALQNKEGFAWPSNGYFARLYDVDSATVSGWVRQLVDASHIKIDMVKIKTGTARRIWLTSLLAGGSLEKAGEGSPGKAGEGEGGSLEKAGEGSPGKAGPNNKELNSQDTNSKELFVLRSDTQSTELKRKVIYDYNKRIWRLTQSDIDFWEECYDGVDVRKELFQMKAWLDSHPKKSNFKRFITNWLSKAQDRSRTFARPLARVR